MAQSELNDHTEPKYRDEEWLREEYVSKKRSADDLADECGVTPPCIINWMERYGIERRSYREAQTPDARYTDEEWLREKYVGEDMTMQELADICDCNRATIFNWLHKFGIETREVEDWSSGRGNGNWVEHATLLENNNGYLVSQSQYEGDREVFPVHRLAAVAWYGWDAVVDKEIHHRIPAKSLNIESNVLPLPEQEHRIVSGYYLREGVPEEIVEDVLDGLGR